MPDYTHLKQFRKQNDPSWQISQYKDPILKLKSIAENLRELKKGLKDSIPQKTVSDTLLLATWNLREFDSNGKKLGPRLEESYYYIAEIINAFDIVALQEIKENLTPLKRLVKILGKGWDYFVTDITVGPSGNGERMAFVYDKAKVFFTNIVGQVVLPQSNAKSKQFARTPFYVSFQAGWLKLNLCTVHIYYGSGKTIKRRLKELEDISLYFEKRIKQTKENYILLGDFNVVGKNDDTVKALLKGKFKIPSKLLKSTKGSNLDRSKFYDQIIYHETSKQIKFTNADVFDYYKYVFNSASRTKYRFDYNMLRTFNNKKRIKTLNEKLFDQWKTFQMSDHLPLWVEFKIDFSDKYLQYLKVDPRYLS